MKRFLAEYLGPWNPQLASWEFAAELPPNSFQRRENPASGPGRHLAFLAF